MKGWSWQNGNSVGKRDKDMKIPDAITTKNDGTKIAVEVERNIKSQKRYKKKNYL